MSKTHVVGSDPGMSFEFCRYETDGAIAVITITRPYVLNALHGPAMDELAEAWNAFEADDEVLVAILTGEGERSFCAGADIKSMVNGTFHTPKEGFAGFTNRKMNKPVLAAVNGFALGGGLEAMLACDIAVAAEHAMFGVPEIRNVGGLPGDGGLVRLPRQVPLKIAMEMLLTGGMIDAQAAFRAGLVNHVVPADEVMGRTMEIARSILENPRASVCLSKEYALRSLDMPLERPTTAWDLYDMVLPKLMATEDMSSLEGPRGFVEKRRPEWTGR